ncbi:MAG: hypothetical protein EXS08_13460 [Planctomycetes bacterium]|nr:hypothetical protein [Planctomycetota bacterium]
MLPNGAAPARRSPWFWVRIALWILALNTGVFFLGLFLVSLHEGLAGALLILFTALALAQLFFGITATVVAIRLRRATGQSSLGACTLGVLTALGALVGWAGGMVATLLAAGGGWGRPLRVRGRQTHPGLRVGADWTRGERPDPAGLDEPTRRALEALWLHDAQKEHASVPAFARVAWLLAAVGAPAELLAWCHRAALEEIEHARLCFALACGYAGRSHTVRPMPELLRGALDLEGDALVVLATESLADGCQLEDFNADIAAECAEVCAEPATRAVLLRIAREERSHAEFSWALVGWLLESADDTVRPALEQALARLSAYARPTAVSWHKRSLVARADPAELRRHGRLLDERWGELWQARLVATTARTRQLLAATRSARARLDEKPELALRAAGD